MNKKMNLGVIALACVLMAGTANADVGFINDPVLAQKSTALQGLQMQYSKMMAMLKVEIEEELADIVAAKKELVRKEKELSKAEIGERMDSIEKKEKDLQARAQKVSAEMQKNLTEAAVKVKEKGINPIVKDLAEKNDFDAVLNAANAFYMEEKLDITDEVIELLNKKMPKVTLEKVTLPKPKK